MSQSDILREEFLKIVSKIRGNKEEEEDKRKSGGTLLALSVEEPDNKVYRTDKDYQIKQY